MKRVSFLTNLSSRLFFACGMGIFAAIAICGVLKVAAANADNLYERFFIATLGMLGLFIMSKTILNAKGR